MKYMRSHYTLEERLKIIKEYETSNLSGNEVAKKYGLKGGTTITSWRERLQKSEKSITFAASNDTKVKEEVPMKERTPEELDAEIKRLTKELEFANLKVMALNTMIDIAEEQGIQIRKKSGAKQ